MSRASQRYGKKIGKLEVKLDRKKTRYKWASIEVELRFDLDAGTFWAQWESAWYSADTKDELSAQIKVAATKTLSLEWKRYIRIHYEARSFPIADSRSGRPKSSGTCHDLSLSDDRTKFDDKDEKHAITSIELNWSVCEISEPYALPEDLKKCVRASRSVDIAEWGPDMGKEEIGEPQEWEDDILPHGTFLWTPEREAFLAEIITALSRLDQRFVDLFSGDTEQLANKIDTASQTDPSRLLVAPAESESPRPKKQRRLS